MSTRPIISTDQNHSYQPFLPMTTLMWRKVCGFEPIILLTDTPTEWGSTRYGKVVLETLWTMKADVHFVGAIEGHKSGQVAQSCRQHAAALDLPEDDFLVTADQDMWPLNREWFKRHEGHPDKFTLWYANAYGPVVPPSSPPYYPTPYVGAAVKLWREVIGLRKTGEVGTQLQTNLDRTLGRRYDSWLAWNHDELFFGARLKAWDGHPSRCQFVNREGQPPHDRIDRSGWPVALSKEFLADKVDAHCIRPPVMPPNWKPLRDLLLYYLDSTDMAFIDSFVKEYRKARYE